jgi:hypothetical protein
MAKKKKAKKVRAKKSGMSKAARRKAGKKAAATRAAKKARRSAAAKKAYRSRKGGKRKAARASEPKRKKGKRKGGKSRKGGKKGKRRSGKRMDTATYLVNTKAKLANIEARYESRLAAYKAKMSKASDAEKNRLREKLVKLEAERGKEIARIKASSDKKLAALQAAEGKKRKGKRKGGKKGKRRSKARRNPIGSGGGHEYLATAAGVLTGVLLTVLPYRMLRSHALSAGGAQGAVDAPAQGDVPNLLTGQLPVWSKLKWKGALALGAVLILDIALPLTAAAMIESSDGWKTYFQLWGWTGITLGTTKVTLDLLGLATKNTLIGQRMFAPENTARDVRVQSAAAQLPAITVAPGLGMQGLVGYGRAQGCSHVGAGQACCADCEKYANKTPPTGGLPITGTTPLSGQPAAPPGTPMNQGTVPGSMPGSQTAVPLVALPGTQYSTPRNPSSNLPPGRLVNTGAGAVDKFAPKNRFASKNRFSA